MLLNSPAARSGGRCNSGRRAGMTTLDRGLQAIAAESRRADLADLVRKLFDLRAKGDVEAILKWFAPDFIYKACGGWTRPPYVARQCDRETFAESLRLLNVEYEELGSEISRAPHRRRSRRSPPNDQDAQSRGGRGREPRRVGLLPVPRAPRGGVCGLCRTWRSSTGLKGRQPSRRYSRPARTPKTQISPGASRPASCRVEAERMTRGTNPASRAAAST